MPRSEPHTALQHIANHAVSVAAAQNQLLPMPSETGRNYEQSCSLTQPTSCLPVVMEDPVNKTEYHFNTVLKSQPLHSLLSRSIFKRFGRSNMQAVSSVMTRPKRIV